MCGYCNEIDDVKDVILISGDDTELMLFIWKYESDNSWVIADAYSGDDSINIEYCPMCGRKLND